MTKLEYTSGRVWLSYRNPGVAQQEGRDIWDVEIWEFKPLRSGHLPLTVSGKFIFLNDIVKDSYSKLLIEDKIDTRVLFEKLKNFCYNIYRKLRREIQQDDRHKDYDSFYS